eukprot:scaffold301095_cov19-Tisochrysis_lutea.AAC.2
MAGRDVCLDESRLASIAQITDLARVQTLHNGGLETKKLLCEDSGTQPGKQAAYIRGCLQIPSKIAMTGVLTRFSAMQAQRAFSRFHDWPSMARAYESSRIYELNKSD